MTKKAVLSAILQSLETELEVLQRGARSSFDAATDPDSRAENKYDTRTLEASYVARGQAQRVSELQEAVHEFGILAQNVPVYDTVRIGALMTLDNEVAYFMGPLAGGTEAVINGQEILVVTPASPLGQKLMGCREGDSIELNGRRLTVTALA